MNELDWEKQKVNGERYSNRLGFCNEQETSGAKMKWYICISVYLARTGSNH